MRTRADWDEIIRLTNEGISRKDIAELLGIHVRAVQNVLRPLGLLNEKRSEGGKAGYKKNIAE